MIQFLITALFVAVFAFILFLLIAAMVWVGNKVLRSLFPDKFKGRSGKAWSLASSFGCAIGGFGLLIWIAEAAACSVGTSISVPKLAMQSGRSSLGKCKSPAFRRGIRDYIFLALSSSFWNACTAALIFFSCFSSSRLILPSSFMAAISQERSNVDTMACMFNIWACM